MSNSNRSPLSRIDTVVGNGVEAAEAPGVLGAHRCLDPVPHEGVDAGEW